MSKLLGAPSFFAMTAIALLIVFAAAPAQSGEREAGTDRPGLDFRDFELTAPLPAQCETACNDDNKCRAWTFAWPGKKGPRAHCFLKSGLPPKKSDNCCISGIKTKQTLSTNEKKVKQEPTPEPVIETPPEQSLADACQEYAETAVDQNRQNDELQCGLTGSRWGYDFAVYHNWCMTKSTKETRKNNNKARDKELEGCRAYFGIPSPKKPKLSRDLIRESACRDYANRAIEQSEGARKLGCGFTGVRWAPAFRSHFSWCMSVSMAYQAREILERKSALDSCRPRQSRDTACEQYAQTAFRLARQNYERRCGFTGPRWRRNTDAHKRWCQSVNNIRHEHEQSARYRALAACSGGVRVVSACARYAQGALKHAHDNQQRNCGLTGTRWRPDYETHFIWCMQARPPQRHAERIARIKTLLKCSSNIKGRYDDGTRLYSYRWRKVPGGNGNWNSGWIRSGSRRVCVHKVVGCRCGWQNYCSDYRTGDIVLWWRDGCHREPVKIICETRER